MAKGNVERWLLFVFLYIFGASVLGLVQPMMFGGVELFAFFWETDGWADVTFVCGMLVSGLAGWQLSRQLHPAFGGLIAGVLTWLTYAFSLTLVLQSVQEAPANFPKDAAFILAATWGWPGILFGAVAPTVVAWLDARGEKNPFRPVGDPSPKAPEDR